VYKKKAATAQTTNQSQMALAKNENQLPEATLSISSCTVQKGGEKQGKKHTQNNRIVHKTLCSGKKK